MIIDMYNKLTWGKFFYSNNANTLKKSPSSRAARAKVAGRSHHQRFSIANWFFHKKLFKIWDNRVR